MKKCKKCKKCKNEHIKFCEWKYGLCLNIAVGKSSLTGENLCPKHLQASLYTCQKHLEKHLERKLNDEKIKFIK